MQFNQTLRISPSVFAIVTVPQVSLNTFTVVRHISRNGSTASINPTPSRGKPTAVRTTEIITSPAIGIPAAPIEARSAVNTTIICCRKLISIPYACAINIAATHSYKAVPSILIVAPSGSTKLEILFETPSLFSTASIVSGSVADDERVENAVSKGVVNA